MELTAWLAPIGVIICVILALRGTRVVKKDKEIPKDLLGLANSMADMTNSERKWGLK